MAIFNCYVSSPEGTSYFGASQGGFWTTFSTSKHSKGTTATTALQDLMAKGLAHKNGTGPSKLPVALRQPRRWKAGRWGPGAPPEDPKVSVSYIDPKSHQRCHHHDGFPIYVYIQYDSLSYIYIYTLYMYMMCVCAIYLIFHHIHIIIISYSYHIHIIISYHIISIIVLSWVFMGTCQAWDWHCHPAVPHLDSPPQPSGTAPWRKGQVTR